MEERKREVNGSLKRWGQVENETDASCIKRTFYITFWNMIQIDNLCCNIWGIKSVAIWHILPFPRKENKLAYETLRPPRLKHFRQASQKMSNFKKISYFLPFKQQTKVWKSTFTFPCSLQPLSGNLTFTKECTYHSVHKHNKILYVWQNAYL